MNIISIIIVNNILAYILYKFIINLVNNYLNYLSKLHTFTVWSSPPEMKLKEFRGLQLSELTGPLCPVIDVKSVPCILFHIYIAPSSLPHSTRSSSLPPKQHCSTNFSCKCPLYFCTISLDARFHRCSS